MIVSSRFKTNFRRKKISMVTLILPPPQHIHRWIITMSPQTKEAKLKWDRLSYLAQNKFRAHARAEHELVPWIQSSILTIWLVFLPWIITYQKLTGSYMHTINTKRHDDMVLQYRILHLENGVLKKISHQASHVPSLFWIKGINYKTYEQEIILSFTSQLFFPPNKYFSKTRVHLSAVGCNSPALTFVL